MKCIRYHREEMPQLSEDIVHMVCQHIEGQERRRIWVNLSYVCKTWRAAVTPLLYRTIDFTTMRDKSSFDHFVRTIAQNPTQAQHVQAINFSRSQMRERASREEPLEWDRALNEARASEKLRQRLERDLQRGGGSAYAAKGALLLLLCRNLMRVGLTDCDIYDMQSPLFMVLEMVRMSSPTVLTKLASLDLLGSGLIRVEKLKPFLQLPKLERLALFDIADVSTQLLSIVPGPLETIRRFHYTPMGQNPTHRWSTSRREVDEDILDDIFRSLPGLVHLTLVASGHSSFWENLLSTYNTYLPPLKHLGVQSGWSDIAPDLRNFTLLESLRISSCVLFQNLLWRDTYDPDRTTGPHSKHHLSEILPASIKHLHFDDGRSGFRREESEDSKSVARMHTDQILELFSTPNFCRLQSLVVSTDYFGGRTKDRHEVPEHIAKWAEGGPWDVWTWKHAYSWYACFELTSAIGAGTSYATRIPPGPFVYT